MENEIRVWLLEELAAHSDCKSNAESVLTHSRKEYSCILPSNPTYSQLAGFIKTRKISPLEIVPSLLFEFCQLDNNCDIYEALGLPKSPQEKDESYLYSSGDKSAHFAHQVYVEESFGVSPSPPRMKTFFRTEELNPQENDAPNLLNGFDSPESVNNSLALPLLSLKQTNSQSQSIIGLGPKKAQIEEELVKSLKILIQDIVDLERRKIEFYNSPGFSLQRIFQILSSDKQKITLGSLKTLFEEDDEQLAEELAFDALQLLTKTSNPKECLLKDLRLFVTPFVSNPEELVENIRPDTIDISQGNYSSQKKPQIPIENFKKTSSSKGLKPPRAQTEPASKMLGFSFQDNEDLDIQISVPQPTPFSPSDELKVQANLEEQHRYDMSIPSKLDYTPPRAGNTRRDHLHATPDALEEDSLPGNATLRKHVSSTHQEEGSCSEYSSRPQSKPCNEEEWKYYKQLSPIKENTRDYESKNTHTYKSDAKMPILEHQNHFSKAREPSSNSLNNSDALNIQVVPCQRQLNLQNNFRNSTRKSPNSSISPRREQSSPELHSNKKALSNSSSKPELYANYSSEQKVPQIMNLPIEKSRPLILPAGAVNRALEGLNHRHTDCSMSRDHSYSIVQVVSEAELAKYKSESPSREYRSSRLDSYEQSGQTSQSQLKEHYDNLYEAPTSHQSISVVEYLSQQRVLAEQSLKKNRNPGMNSGSSNRSSFFLASRPNTGTFKPTSNSISISETQTKSQTDFKKKRTPDLQDPMSSLYCEARSERKERQQRRLRLCENLGETISRNSPDKAQNQQPNLGHKNTFSQVESPKHPSKSSRKTSVNRRTSSRKKPQNRGETKQPKGR